jgi:hypothetical protein
MRVILLIMLFPSLFLFSQKDTSLFQHKFFLEINSGFNKFNIYTESSTPNGNDYLTSLNSLNIDFNFNFRNRYFKLGCTFFSYDYIFSLENSVAKYGLTIGANLAYKHFANDYSKQNKLVDYFGPSFSFGRMFNVLVYPWFNYTNIGLDLYVHDFYFNIYYSKLFDISKEVKQKNEYINKKIIVL